MFMWCWEMGKDDVKIKWKINKSGGYNLCESEWTTPFVIRRPHVVWALNRYHYLKQFNRFFLLLKKSVLNLDKTRTKLCFPRCNFCWYLQTWYRSSFNNVIVVSYLISLLYESVLEVNNIYKKRTSCLASNMVSNVLKKSSARQKPVMIHLFSRKKYLLDQKLVIFCEHLVWMN